MIFFAGVLSAVIFLEVILSLSHIFVVVFFQTVAYKMLATTVILILVGISVTSAQELSCKTIMTSFYQTEDQYYDLGCDGINKESEKVLLYRCRFLQKKMDIVGRQYYDFGVNVYQSINTQIRFDIPLL